MIGKFSFCNVHVDAISCMNNLSIHMLKILIRRVWVGRQGCRSDPTNEGRLACVAVTKPVFFKIMTLSGSTSCSINWGGGGGG